MSKPEKLFAVALVIAFGVVGLVGYEVGFRNGQSEAKWLEPKVVNQYQSEHGLWCDEGYRVKLVNNNGTCNFTCVEESGR